LIKLLIRPHPDFREETSKRGKKKDSRYILIDSALRAQPAPAKKKDTVHRSPRSTITSLDPLSYRRGGEGTGLKKNERHTLNLSSQNQNRAGSGEKPLESYLGALVKKGRGRITGSMKKPCHRSFRPPEKSSLRSEPSPIRREGEISG